MRAVLGEGVMGCRELGAPLNHGVQARQRKTRRT